MSTQFIGHIDEHGKMKIFHQQDLLTWIDGHKSKLIVLTIKEHKKQRSTLQNAYYWGVVVPTVKEGMNAFGLWQ